MKKFIAVLFSSCLLSVGLQAHMDSNMPGNSFQMMNMQVDVTENDLLTQLNDQDRALYQQLNPQQKAFVVRAINQFSNMQTIMKKMMMQKMRDNHMNQDQMQQGHNHFMKNLVKKLTYINPNKGSYL